MSGNHHQQAIIGQPTIAILPPLPETSTSTEPISTTSQQTEQLQNNSNTNNSTNANSNGLLPNPDISSPRLSSSWSPDSQSNYCTSCQSPFDPLFKRKHHCRLCGNVFCNDCSNTRSLIPPSALVLRTKNSVGGIQVGPSFNSLSNTDASDASITYVTSDDNDTLLYGRGLERRILLARTPQRTCHPCKQQLAPLQNELCLRNSNSMRYNYIDEGDAVRRLCNSPLAFTLGHEVRKAAYALGNLLPGNKSYTAATGGGGGSGGIRSNGFVPTVNESDLQYSYPPPESDPCHVPNGGGCKTIDPTLRNVDKLHIPARLLQRARGVAIVTSCKGGLGFAGFEFGTGLVVARRQQGDSGDNNLDDWSAPSAIGIAGFAWGALVGAQVSDHVFLLMTDDAVRLFSSDKGKSIQLGADVGVALGPLGRSAEADIGATSSVSRSLDGSYGSGGVALAPIYTYSLSKGLYAGISLDGRVLMTRDRVNEKFYGRTISAHELLSGQVATPPAAQPLYDALKRCRIYGGGGGGSHNDHGALSGSRIRGDNSYNVHGSINRTGSSGGGGLMERISHTTGAGLPVSSTTNSRYSSPNPYNLSARENFNSGFSE